MAELNDTMAIAGLLLFLLGLINGLIIPFGRSPRLSLSAHLTAVQSGTFLIAMSLLWPHIGAPDGLRAAAGVVLLASLYLLWLALLFAGMLGAGHGLPIAGAGVTAKPAIQIAVSALLLAGIVGTTSATAVLAYWMSQSP